MTNIQKFATDLAAWADANFPNSGPTRCIDHLAEEVEEIKAAPHDRMEYADAFMLLLDAYRRAGLGTVDDLIRDASIKLEECKKRVWLPPDSAGIIRHQK